ncbi:MAG: hypothetical protein IR526_01475 [Bordetella sp.]|nr:MAG: hypothetical protein IR526_01475 [Bordetella sp.]
MITKVVQKNKSLQNEKKPVLSYLKPIEDSLSRSRGRKLRTPFRRRRGDAFTNEYESNSSRYQENSLSVPAIEYSSDEEKIFSFLETSDRTAQRLKKYLNNEEILPKLHKILAESGIGSRRDMEDLIISGRVSVNGEPAHIGQRIGQKDLVKVNGRPINRNKIIKIPRIIIYHKISGESIDQKNLNETDNIFSRLPKLRNGKWNPVNAIDINTEGLLIFTTSGDLVNRIVHPRYKTERECFVRILGEVNDEKYKLLIEKDVNIGQEKTISITSFDYVGGDGANQWYKLVLHESKYRDINRIFEIIGCKINRLICTRFGNITLPRGLRRGDGLN